MKTDAKTRKMSTKVIVEIGMLSAVAVVLMYFDIPLPFAPSFYKIDFSEVPVLIGCFSMGPAAGITIEAVKNLLILVVKGTTTGGVGEFANFLIGCSLILPASIIYCRHKTKKSALTGMVTGTIVMTVIGCVLNAYVLLPAYSVAFGMPIEALVKMGSEVNGGITNLFTFVCFAVAPFNLLKGFAVSLITMLLYKKMSILLKGNY